MNCFGNYLCQKLIEFANNKQIEQIIDRIKFNFIKICLNSFGTRSIQKLYEVIKDENNITNLNYLIQIHIDTISQVNLFL